MRHLKTMAMAALLSLFVAANPGPGVAGSEEDCTQSRNPKLSRDACTALIETGDFSGDQLGSIHFNRANARRRLHDLEGALEDYQEAARLNPKSFGYVVNMAATKSMLGRNDEAIQDLGEALKLAPGDPRVLYNRAKMLRATGRSEEALADLDAALRARPDYTLALLMRGLVRHAAGDADAAQDWQAAFKAGGERFAIRVQVYLQDRGYYGKDTVATTYYAPKVEAALAACAPDLTCF